jgi:hypothetical protein
LCDGNEECANYVLNWQAFHVQCPSKKVETALVVVGDQGSGKTTVFDMFGNRVLGSEMYYTTTQMEQVCGKFNSAVANRKSVVLNEADMGEKWNMMSSLKALITDRTVPVRELYCNPYKAINVAGIAIVSNYDLPVKVETGERRFLCLRTSNKYLGNVEYFDQFYKHVCTAAGADAVMYMLMNRDLEGWNQRVLPNTEEKIGMMQASFNPVQAFLFAFVAELVDMLKNGNTLDGVHILDEQKTEICMSSVDMRTRYHAYSAIHGNKPQPDGKFGKALKSSGVENVKHLSSTFNASRPPGYAINVFALAAKFGIATD